MEHLVKSWSGFFQAVADGRKSFEVRRADRGYSVGDVITLCEWDPERSDYTGSRVIREIVYIMPGGIFGVEPGFVVLGLR